MLCWLVGGLGFEHGVMSQVTAALWRLSARGAGVGVVLGRRRLQESVVAASGFSLIAS